ncbi:hypothetical protein [Pontibacter pamirensis]|uniref:hypothetical protein n=1 Tax=Pontibacter pamirensis TaxID=2562824 RepID=UPI001389D820|nr:hypothetical protein [Pontibacter pamirensis]
MTLEYVKTILLKVSFDRTLFEKELIKGLKVLEQEELPLLERWCYEKFCLMHLLVLDDIFSLKLRNAL